MQLARSSPGTVSRILWHFTGGPVWDEDERRQGSSPKPAARAYANLRSILKSSEVRLGGYKELIRVRFAEKRKYNRKTKKVEVLRNVTEELTSSPVCCLADIPIAHLAYVAPRYGKFAIGFHRHAVVRHGFNPVFYALDDARSILSIYRGLAQFDSVGGEIFKVCGGILKESMEDFLVSNALSDSPDLSFLEVIAEQADALDDSLREARSSFEDFLGLVKTFSTEEFGTIYCEREWRSLSPFRFSHDAIAMIVLPRKVGKNEYFEPFCQRLSATFHLPVTIPVLPWEDLVEH
jgi:hypothetical protein